MDTCFHKNCELTFEAKAENHALTTHKHKLAIKPFGKPPFTNDDVFRPGHTFAPYMVLPDSTEMAPRHPSEHELLKVASGTCTIPANLHSENAVKATKKTILTLPALSAFHAQIYIRRIPQSIMHKYR